MGQREDVQASLNQADEHRDVYAARTVRREGWRARLAHVEAMLCDARDNMTPSDTRRLGFAAGRIRKALGEVQGMLDEMPQIGVSQRAPVEVPPVSVRANDEAQTLSALRPG